MTRRRRPAARGAGRASGEGTFVDIGGVPSPAAPTYPRRRTAAPPVRDGEEPSGLADASQANRRGYRTSKRSTKAGKKARRAARLQRIKEGVAERTRSASEAVVLVLKRVAACLVVAGLVVALALGASVAINALSRHMAKRAAERAASPEAVKERARENLLIIGSDPNVGADFLAIRLDKARKQIMGIAISDGAFMEVPGQGFERVGDSFKSGPDTSLATVSNYLGVLFDKYVVVDRQTYQDILKSQSLAGMFAKVSETNLSEEERSEAARFVDSLGADRVILVPLPVRPINMGDQTYFEPQRDKIADLLMTWWDVSIGAEQARVSVIIYNGAGVPGLAGEAAQALIRAGMRVVDTKNADRFDYAETMIIEQKENSDAGEKARAVLGVGKVMVQPSEQEVADIIIIVGRDYKPPKE